MPRDDLPPGSGTAGVAVAEQFTARNAHGQATLIRKRAASVHEDSLGGLHFGGGAADFELTDGSPVVRVDEFSYRIVHTGEVLRREEGQHGSTQHRRAHYRLRLRAPLRQADAEPSASRLNSPPETSGEDQQAATRVAPASASCSAESINA